MALVIVLIVNCVQAFSKHFYLEVLSGTNVTALVFHFLNKLSAAACALGKPLHSGKISIFLLFSLGKKTNPCRLGCNIHKEQKNNNMGMTKEAVLAADFDSVIRASLQLLILDLHAAIYM